MVIGFPVAGRPHEIPLYVYHGAVKRTATYITLGNHIPQIVNIKGARRLLYMW